MVVCDGYWSNWSKVTVVGLTGLKEWFGFAHPSKNNCVVALSSFSFKVWALWGHTEEHTLEAPICAKPLPLV